VDVCGPTSTKEDASLGRTALEWSNALAEIVHDHTGKLVSCTFASSLDHQQGKQTVELHVRSLFELSSATGEPLPVIDEQMVEPGELTQSLCSPWQNDYKECACYYWPRVGLTTSTSTPTSKDSARATTGWRANLRPQAL